MNRVSVSVMPGELSSALAEGRDWGRLVCLRPLNICSFEEPWLPVGCAAWFHNADASEEVVSSRVLLGPLAEAGDPNTGESVRALGQSGCD